MMWQRLLLPHHLQVLSKFLYISCLAQPLESHRFSGDEKTRLQTWHLSSSGPTSALIFSGNARPTSPMYTVQHNTHRPQATYDRWSVRCLGSCSCAGADEFVTGRKRVENRSFCWTRLNIVILFGNCNDFCPPRKSESTTTCPRWRGRSRDVSQEISCRERNLGCH